MPDVMEVLARYKESTRSSYAAFLGRAVTPVVPVPKDAAEALRLGILLGRQEGYGEGLVQGTKLGMDVSQEVMEALLAQPVFFGTVGLA